MKINKIISAATAAVMLVSASAFAAEIEYRISDIETGTMTVSVNSSLFKPSAMGYGKYFEPGYHSEPYLMQLTASSR